MGARYPLGVYDHEPDEDVPFLKSVGVGDSFPSRLAKDLTGAVNKVDSILDGLIPF